MKDIETEEAKEVGKDQSAKVQVTVVYTATAKEKKFLAETTDTLASVIDTAYDRLKEERRPGDRYFCSEEPRHDLAPHLSQALRQMHKAGVCVKEKNRNKLEFEFDIDSDIGGAALLTIPSPVNRFLAEAAVSEFFDSTDWMKVADRHGWVMSMIDPLIVMVAMTATGGSGLADQYTLRLACDYYPTGPPDAIFVNPKTLEYTHGKDNVFVPKLEADYCRTHLNYTYDPPHKYGPQLVCSSMTLGYYVSKHQPTPDQVWTPGRHNIGSTLDAIQRAMRSSHYKGRHE